MSDGWTWLVDNDEWVRNLCVQNAPGDAHKQDECYSECVDRALRCWEIYDPSLRVPRDAHMKVSLRWYVWKKMRKCSRELLVDDAMLDMNIAPHVDLDAREEVSIIVKQLSEYEGQLLILYHCYGMNFVEMADVFDKSKGAIRLHYIKAMEHARENGMRRSSYGP